MKKKQGSETIHDNVTKVDDTLIQRVIEFESLVLLSLVDVSSH